MTAKADFTEEEWNVVREGPAAAGMMVLLAHGGGSLRETWALAKTYAEAKQQPGSSALIDEIVSERPDVARHDSAAEQEQQGLAGIREAIGVLEQKAAPDEVEAYRAFVLEVATRVAKAHEEEGEPITPDEEAALEKIRSSLGSTAS
jgi:hypothetical protein